MSFARYPSLADRVAFVTGGGSGIGAAIVQALAEQGARVAFVDILEDASRSLIQQLSDVDHQPLFIQCDLNDIGALRQAIQRVYQELGPIGILVNNAASDERHEVDKVTPDYWDSAMDVNLRHQFFAAQAVRPHM
ncbi:MAG: SDR family NAD(P)-dependent oxidoreductase, partial [bacterium]